MRDMLVKRYKGTDIGKIREEIERECGPHAAILSFRYIKPRGIRSLFFGPQVEVLVALSEESSKKPSTGD